MVNAFLFWLGVVFKKTKLPTKTPPNISTIYPKNANIASIIAV
jgi:hypothetical protein